MPVPERLVVVGHRQDSHLSSRLELPNESAVYLGLRFEPVSAESLKGARPRVGNWLLSQSARVVLPGLDGVYLRARL